MGQAGHDFAGGGEELDWTLSELFDAMGAMSSKYNASPQSASRAYDLNRDGFVISGGGGILVLEELEHAKARGAKIYAEMVGYGASADGADMVAPSGEGAVRCMKLAIAGVKERSTISTRMPPRPRWRHSRDQRHSRSLRSQDAADQRHQVAHRPQPGRGGGCMRRSIRC